MTAEVSNTRIQIHFDVHQPIELIEMTLALQSLAHEYQSFLSSRAAIDGRRTDPNAIKIYVTKIESNGILAELAGAAPFLGQLMALMDHTVVFADFVKMIKAQFDYFHGLYGRNDVAPEDVPYSKAQIDRFKSLMGLVAKNKEGHLKLGVIQYSDSAETGEMKLQMSFTSDQASQAEKGAINAKRALETKVQADEEKVLMYFYQANVDDPKSGGRTGDKAIVKRVSDKPLPVFILPETEQQRIRYILDDSNHNPLTTGFMVDVNVEKDARDIPRAYRVIKIHEVIYPEPDD